MIARNFTYRGMKGEIDLVGYDGATIAFVEVKTRTATHGAFRSSRRSRHSRKTAASLANGPAIPARIRVPAIAPFRFDILAIEAPPGARPVVRLHKGAFAA